MEISEIQEAVHRTAIEHGWWESPRLTGEVLMLMVTELVDLIIRLLDFTGGTGLDIEGALSAKMAYNESRSYRHGGKVA